MSKVTVRIRPLTEADAGPFDGFRREIAAEDDRARETLPLGDELRRSFESFRAELPLPAPNTVLGAFVNGDIVGAAVVLWPGALSLQQDCANLWGMFVLPRMRSHGLGRLLLRQAVEHAFGLGMTCIQLQLLIPNDTALRLYRSEGFEVFEPDASATYFPGSYQDCIHMRIDNPLPGAPHAGTTEVTR